MEQTELPSILIVDDDETLCDVLAAALALAGHPTHTARTAEAVRSALGVRAWTLVLIDTLGAPPGVEAEKVLLDVCERAGRAPVLVMTGSTEVAAWADSNLPVAGVLRKPFDLEPFLQRVAELVPQNER